MQILLSNSSDKPIYSQIASQIKTQIFAKELKTGDALPSMRLLAKELRISVITTKRAYEELERDGFIETVAGKGCFVSAQNTELVREETLRMVQASLETAIDCARRGGVSAGEVREMVAILLEDNI